MTRPAGGLLKPTSRTRRRQRTKGRECCCCRNPVPFCWNCPCGLCVCQLCMDENRWGLTCNDITWQCPDCGRWHGFGNA